MMTYLNLKPLKRLFYVVFLYLIITFIIIFTNIWEIELKKSIVFFLVGQFFFGGAFLIPIYIYSTVIPEKYITDPYGGIIRVTIIISCIVSFFLFSKVYPRIQNIIDPNAEIKQKISLKLEQIENINNFEIRKIENQLITYKGIKVKLLQINENRTFNDIPELNAYINLMETELNKQKEEIINIKMKNDLKLSEFHNYYIYIDSIYNSSKLIEKEISNIVHKNTIFKQEKYFDYFISFLIGFMLNFIFYKKTLKKTYNNV